MEQRFSDQLRAILRPDVAIGFDALLDAVAEELAKEKKAAESEVAHVLHETAEVIHEVATKVLEMPKKAFGELKQVLFDHNTEELALDATAGCQCTDCTEARAEAEGQTK